MCTPLGLRLWLGILMIMYNTFVMCLLGVGNDRCYTCKLDFIISPTLLYCFSTQEDLIAAMDSE